MSATVTYKGETLTTATNQTRVLETEGKYLEDDITITDVTGAAPSGTKNISITTNGTTTEDVTSYATASITTAVPASAVDSGTKSISISSNGTTTHDVVGYASASITANVPNSYSASDEGKVVSSGALVSQTSDTVTANDTYDTTLINSLTVNVSGGGGISQTVHNIASASTSLITGYLANNDSISAQSTTNKEVTTDYIDVSAYHGKKVYIILEITNPGPWIGCRFYNSSKTAQGSRQTAGIGAAGIDSGAYAIECVRGTYTLFCSNPYTVASNFDYIRISFRTYGAAKMCLISFDEFDPSDYFLTRDVQQISFINAIESDGTAT